MLPRITLEKQSFPYMARTSPLLAALPLVILYGLWEGQWTNRWNQSDELERAAARLKNVPMTIGDWQGKDSELDLEALEVAEVAGYVVRTYINRTTGQSVQVLLICGPPGPTAVHTPDVCYRGAGFDMKGQQARHQETIDTLGAPVELWTAEFRKSHSPFPEQLRIYWAWSTSGEWEAPTYPRWHFAGDAALYKFYLIRPLLHGEGAAKDEVCTEFLKEFLPQVNQALFSVQASE